MSEARQTLIYIGFYDRDLNAGESRNYSLAARSKMDYLIGAVRRCGRDVLVVSASQTFDSRSYPAQIVQSAPGVSLLLFRTLPWGGAIRRLLSRGQMKVSLLLWLLRHTGREDDILVYHSLGYASTIGLAHRLRGFRLLLEVEEVYSHVSGRQAEMRMERRLFRRADAFLFPTSRMNSFVNPQGKPFAIAHGSYALEPSMGCALDDGRTHVVYAGTFDQRKGGAQTAIASAKWLDSGYHLHVIGSGSREDTAAIRRLVDEVSRGAQCEVTLEGPKTGEDYVRFLQNCHIGLSTQRPDPMYCDTSFPSKILSYLANGLHVVSVRIPVVEESAVGDLVHYYDEDDGESVARVIMGIDVAALYDSRARIRELDGIFVRELGGLMLHHQS